MPMPPTIHGLRPLDCISALQKCIRRGMEREAMEFAVELIHSSRNYVSMVTKRLEVIAHEDIDTLSQPWIIPYVHASMTQARLWYEPDIEKRGKTRMAVGNTIRLLCRAKKSREGDHFHAALGWGNLLAGKVPEMPDWAYDKHTSKGRRLGRGLDHFREEGTKLVPPQESKDAYEDEAYEMWALKADIDRNKKLL